MDNVGLPDLSGLIGNMLSDPETLKTVLNVASGLKNSGVLSKLGQTASEKEEGREESYGQGGKTYTVKKSTAVKEEDQKRGEELFPEGFFEQAGGRASASPLLPKSLSEKKGDDRLPSDQQRRRELLLALRPYLSRDRQQRLDGILQIFAFLELAEGFGKLGGFDRGREGGI